MNDSNGTGRDAPARPGPESTLKEDCRDDARSSHVPVLCALVPRVVAARHPSHRGPDDAVLDGAQMPKGLDLLHPDDGRACSGARPDIVDVEGVDQRGQDEEEIVVLDAAWQKEDEKNGRERINEGFDGGGG